VLDREELDRKIQKLGVKFLYYAANIFLKSLETTYKTYVFVEDEIINKFKNANAFQNIKNGEIWREYEDIYTNVRYCDWIVLSSTKDKITVSSIKDHSEFKVKEVEPRIMYEYWLKR
jgi:hypothetical protein